MTLNFPTLLKPEQVAKLIGVTVETLAIWRCTKRYSLPYIKSGRRVHYDEADVLRFLKSQKVAVIGRLGIGPKSARRSLGRNRQANIRKAS